MERDVGSRVRREESGRAAATSRGRWRSLSQTEAVERVRRLMRSRRAAKFTG